MNRDRLKLTHIKHPETQESLIDQTLREIDQAILPDFFSRLLAADPELSARIGAADRKVSMAYRGGEREELRAALEDMKGLYLKGASSIYGR